MQAIEHDEPTSLAELQSLARCGMFAALIGAGAFIHVPLGPAHISLQTMLIMLAGFMLGPRKAAVAVAAYLACGFIGLPMFGRGKAGPASFLGPTAGYLAGFAVGAVVAGFAADVAGGRKKRIAAMLVLGLAGTVLILVLGSIGLRLVLIPDWTRAFAVGFLPFLPGDILKLLAAIAVKEVFFPPSAGIR